MMNPTSAKRVMLILSLVGLVITLFCPVFAGAQPLTHTVEKGDTLWGICEKYYGDSELWPKLWEMNPFITNPHLLKPGDIITLFDVEPTKKPKPVEKPPEKAALAPAVAKGVTLSGFANFKALGFLSLSPVPSSGYIHSSDTTRLMVAKGDIVYIDSRGHRALKTGEEFAIAGVSPLLLHPLTEKGFGYTVSIKGRVVIRETLESSFCRGEVTEIYSEVNANDILISYKGASECVQPISTADKLYGNIVATKDQHRVIGQYSVVYIDSGFKKGIHRGQVFELIRLKKVPSPDFQRESLKEIMENLPQETYLTAFWKKLREGKTIYETPVGTLMIVESRPDTATAIVLSSTQELENGAFVKGTSWVKAPEYLLGIPSCTIE